MAKREYKETEYSKKLRDPRWQKKRLEIMQRDEFHCQSCFDSENTLNVHHCYYSYGKEPWDYPEGSLITLCESCHERETDMAAASKADLVTMLCQKKFLSFHFESICNGIIKSNYLKHPDIDSSLIEFFLSNDEAWRLVSELYFDDCRKSVLEKIGIK